MDVNDEWEKFMMSSDGYKKIGLSTTFTKDDGTSITFNDLYKSVKIKDYMTGQVGTLKDLNPKTIYDNMVANGTMDLRPGIENIPASVLVNIPKDGQYISYEQFREQNFITGGGPKEGVDYKVNATFEGEEVCTVMGAKGNASPNPHRGTDTAVIEKQSLPLIYNDSSYVSNVNTDENTIQGKHVDVTTTLNYNFKGTVYQDDILYRTLHLPVINMKKEDSVLNNTVLGITGNTGTWNGSGYGYHAHEDISTAKPSPYLDYLTNNNSNVANRIYHDNRYYYDKFLFVPQSKYTIRSNANTYNR